MVSLVGSGEHRLAQLLLGLLLESGSDDLLHELPRKGLISAEVDRGSGDFVCFGDLILHRFGELRAHGEEGQVVLLSSEADQVRPVRRSTA